MSDAARHQIGNFLLVLAGVLLIVAVLGMSGIIPKYGPSWSFVMCAAVFATLGRGFRRPSRRNLNP